MKNNWEARNSDRILVLTNDDSPLSETALIETLLHFVGYDVLVLSDLPQEPMNCDLIILNVSPVQKAYEIARQLKTSRCSDIPVIVVLRTKAYEVLTEIYQLGVSDYLESPIVDVELISKVALHIELKKNRERIELLYNELRRSLDLSKQLQRMMLPMPLALSGSVWLTSHYQPSEMVGGDVYDFVPSGDEMLIYVADISGHGVQSALLCAAVKSIVRYAWARTDSLHDMLNEVADQLKSVLGHNYVTGLFLKLEANGQITYVNCGHPSLLIYDGVNFREVEMNHTFPLGLIDIEYTQGDEGKLLLEEGKAYVLYTDGIYSPFERGHPFAGSTAIESFLQFLNREVGGAPLQVIPFYVPSRMRTRFGDFPDDYTLIAFGTTDSYVFADSSKFLAYNVSESEEQLVRELMSYVANDDGMILLTKDGHTTTLLTWAVEVGPVLRKLPTSVATTYGELGMIRIFGNH